MMKLRDDIITIFTPVYNRAEYLPRLFDSLMNQTCKRFEWIAVDDGSTDNSYDVLRSLTENAGDIFPATIIRTENSGKHRAWNLASRKAQAEYLICLDSDDYLLPDAVENIHSWIKEIKALPDYRYFAGVSGLRTDGENVIGGAGNGSTFIDATNLERRKYNLDGDKAEVYRTEILRMFPFIEFEGEKFLTEGTVWHLIALAGYKLRWYPVSIMVCKYLPGGLSDSADSNAVKSFDGYTYSTRLRLAVEGMNIKRRLGAVGRYAFIAKKRGLSNSEAAKKLGVGKFSVLLASVIWKIYRGIKDLLRKGNKA